jgi:biofilm PGA synthesis N-glycosyltransferase PgaC
VIGRLFWLAVGLVTYAFAGYPVLLAAAARRARRPVGSPAPPAAPAVTLLVAAYNEEAVIGAKLENALALDYPPDRLQILVATDGSDDLTTERVASFAERGVELSHHPARRGKMAAIERALPCVRGEIIVLSDANNLFAPDALRALVRPFSDPQVAAVSGAKHIATGDGPLGDSEGLYWRYESFLKERETRLASAAAVAGEMLAIRREALEPVPAGVVNEDTYLAIRLLASGGRVVYAPDARSYERVSASAAGERARRARIFAGRWQQLGLALTGRVLPWRDPVVLWQVASHQFARTLSGPALAAALALNVLAVARPARRGPGRIRRLAPPVDRVLLGAQAVFYLSALAGARLELRGAAGRLVYVPTFLANVAVASLVGLSRFATSGQRTTWERVARRTDDGGRLA